MAVTRSIAVSNPFPQYLSEIDRTPLLTRADEYELAARIAKGDVEARDELIRANLRLVVYLAKQYAGQGLSLDDLVAEGNMGLLRAVEGFDPAMNNRFGTYASFWVRQSMRRALNSSGRVTSIPSYVTSLIVKWHRAKAALRNETGDTPDEEAIGRRLRLTAKQLVSVRRALAVHASGAPQANDDSSPLDRIPADRFSNTERAGADEVGQVLHFVDSLGERESMVVRMRFGLNGGDPKTLKEIGTRLGLTRERVRQIEADALAKLRGHITAP